MLQLGFFIFFNILAFGFFFFTITRKASLLTDGIILFSMLLFLMLGFYLLIEEPIGTQITYTDDLGMNITETHTFIEDRETLYLVWIYWGLSVLALLVFFLGHIPQDQLRRWGLMR